LVRSALGTSVDFSRLLAMVLVGIATFIATASIATYWLRRRAIPEEDREAGAVDGLEDRRIAAVAGAGLGLAWVLMFISVLILLPVDSPISRSAANSHTGGVLIGQQRVLQWLTEGFPHYTQTLPKGESGVVVGERQSLPMHGDDEPRARDGDADLLLAAVNDLRRAHRVTTLAFNPDVAGVARRHALSLAAEHTLSYRTPGGAKLDDRVQAALGESSASFSDEVGIEVVWAHNPANAGNGLTGDSGAARLLVDDRWSEVGIGTADAGWFNGRIYVVVLVGPAPEATDDGSSGGAGDTGALDDGSTDLQTPADGDTGAAAAAGELT
ncbi:MAG: hypothetical protein JWM98_3237, partial [Thermoleophilia bacterium]|nr:hypothetical protein [Thermoleophilia bacterium]